MNKRKRQQARESAEARKAHRVRLRGNRYFDRVTRARQVEDTLAKAREISAADRFLRQSAYTEATNSNNGKYERLIRTIERKTPRLLTQGYRRELEHICRYEWLRNVEDWKPKGKGTGTRYRSLCEHLFAKYPVPAFLWSVFDNDDHPQRGKYSLPRCVIHIAQGEGLFKLIKEGVFPGPPMTRRVIHDFMSTPDSNNTTFMRALRRAQIRSHGGTILMYEAWCRSEQGSNLQQDEVFWDTVVRWVCRNPMLDLSELPNLVDYIVHRKGQEPEFSMKGRSVLAMLRLMREWHHDLANARDVKDIAFSPSGLKPGTWYTQKPKSEGDGKYCWTFHEVMSSRELAAEGRHMKHCVYSYTYSISNGHCSIWSMRCDNERMLTVEVRPTRGMAGNGTIVQARGKYNRLATAQEMVVLKEWARKNDLEFRAMRW